MSSSQLPFNAVQWSILRTKQDTLALIEIEPVCFVRALSQPWPAIVPPTQDHVAGKPTADEIKAPRTLVRTRRVGYPPNRTVAPDQVHGVAAALGGYCPPGDSRRATRRPA